MSLYALSDPVLLAIIGGAFTTVSASVTAFFHFLARADRRERAETASGEAREIHILVNDRMTAALRMIDSLEDRLGIPPQNKYIPPPPV